MVGPSEEDIEPLKYLGFGRECNMNNFFSLSQKSGSTFESCRREDITNNELEIPVKSPKVGINQFFEEISTYLGILLSKVLGKWPRVQGLRED